MPIPHLRDPDRIFRLSMERIEAEVDLSALPEAMRPLARRLAHALGSGEAVEALRWGGSPAEAAARALAGGAPVLADCEMVASGVIRALLPAGNEVVCRLNDPRAAERGRARGITRSAAGVELWGEALAGAVVAVGNAPTALFRLLEGLTEEDWPRPAALFAFPVGFVGAAESKEALAEAAPPWLHWAALEGRRGGSAAAAAAVNAAARMVSDGGGCGGLTP